MKWTLLVLVLAACQSDPDNAVRRHHAPSGDDDSDDVPPPPKSHDSPHMPDQNPDYPTPRRAGTDELFRIENPQRGPAISPIQAPDARKLQRTQHARCEVDDAGVVCSRLPPPNKNDPGWTVGTDNGRPVLYQNFRNGHVDESYVLEYDNDGRLTRMTKMDAYGVLDWQRSYWPPGERYTARELDGSNALAGCGAIDVDVGASGLADASTCLQWSGQPMKNTNGASIEKFKRDDEGFVIEEQHFDVGGMPIVGVRDAVHTITWTRDRYENPMTERFADLGGKPVGSHDEHGCFEVDTQYAHDVETKETCIGSGGAPAPRDDGIVIRAFDYNGSWCPTSTRYLDAGGSAAGDENGVYSIRDEVNAECDDVDSKCLGAGGPVACAPDKPAEERITYDKQGRVLDKHYYNADGTDGADPNYDAPEIKMTYDSLGRKLTTSCFTDGARSQCGGLGYHREQAHWDDNGRETDEIYFNEDDSPASNIGIFQTKYTYDNYDHLAEEQGVDENGKLYDAHGMAVRRYYYDDGHRLFGLILLDTHNAPAHYEYCFSELTCPGGDWHALRIIRSPTGHVLSNEFFDAGGNLISSVDCRQQTCWGED